MSSKVHVSGFSRKNGFLINSIENTNTAGSSSISHLFIMIRRNAASGELHRTGSSSSLEKVTYHHEDYSNAKSYDNKSNYNVVLCNKKKMMLLAQNIRHSFKSIATSTGRSRVSFMAILLLTLVISWGMAILAVVMFKEVSPRYSSLKSIKTHPKNIHLPHQENLSYAIPLQNQELLQPFYLLLEQNLKKHKLKFKDNSESFETSECKAMGKWQLDSYPNCNMIHEINQLNNDYVSTKLLSSGSYRDTWLIRWTNGDLFVMKTLVYEDEMSSRNLDRHRRDAVIMSQLKLSIHIPNIYAHCKYCIRKVSLIG